MIDRIHQALDGDLHPSDLSPEELRELERVVALTDRAADRLRRIRSPGVSESVMRRIETSASEVETSTGQASASPRGALIRSLWQPRSVTIRPVWGLLAAAVIAALIVLPSGERGMDGGIFPSDGDEGVAVFVQFRLHAPDASEVRLAGSFTEWEPAHVLHPAGDGSWSVMVPVSPGIHDYAFVVDGTDWRPDPTAPRVDDGFGGENSRLALLLTNGGQGL